MREAQTLAVIAGGVGGAVGAFVGVAVGGSALSVTMTTLGVATVVGVGVIASAVIAGDVEFLADADGVCRDGAEPTRSGARGARARPRASRSRRDERTP